MTLSRKFTIILVVAIASLLTLTLRAQSEKTAVEKLKELKGEVQKIIVKTDDGEVIIEGKDAKTLLKKMKGNSYGTFDILFKDGDAAGNVFITKPNKRFIWRDNDGEEGNLIVVKDILKEDGEHISISHKDANLKVVVEKEDEDGNITKETYEGEEAEEYLEENSFEILDDDGDFDLEYLIGSKLKRKNNVKFFGNNAQFNVLKSEGDGSKVKVIELVEESKDGGTIVKSITIDDNGEPKITIVTTDENGEETTETLEGEEAEEYLEEHSADGNYYFFSEGDNYKIKKHFGHFLLGDDDEGTKIIIKKGDVCDGKEKEVKKIRIKTKKKKDDD